MNSNNSHSLDKVNSFLRGEISAVETYRQALEKMGASAYRRKLEECSKSHSARVELLRQWILQHGGSPAQGSGAWGSFAKLVEGGAKVLGDKMAIHALEEGEDHGRDDYKRELDTLDTETRKFVEGVILPGQLYTHEMMSSLEKGL